MLGDAFASVDGRDTTMNRMLSQIIKVHFDCDWFVVGVFLFIIIYHSKQETSQTEENKVSLKIYMEFDQLDKQLLNDCLKKLSR
jgi:hypothetical protein